ncbi:MerR family transcriptional regulator [uncultured Paracoccus sp.]|uniref:MerR family transcriptional regulator n=1 Tax=uncultured Paracoccus sp. TaxID=189685 RepID=UPI002634F359|nr:MerR family transcriptional regulator [uncultured Paracoccus sp.]
MTRGRDEHHRSRCCCCCGLTAKTIRYHEQIDLVSPQRGPNGYVQFSPKDVQRLKFLGRARRLGFSLQDGSVAQIP